MPLVPALGISVFYRVNYRIARAVKQRKPILKKKISVPISIITLNTNGCNGNYLKLHIIHVSLHVYIYVYSLNENFPAKLTVLPPRATNYQQKPQYQAREASFPVVGQGSPRLPPNIIGYCCCPCLPPRGGP